MLGNHCLHQQVAHGKLLSALLAGAGFGIVMLCSTATAQKWCPDIRGVVTGLNCFAWGIGGAVFDVFFRRIVTSSADGLSFVFWVYLAIVLPILVVAALVLRTPPPSFQVHGKTMHSIPAASAPSPNKIQDEFLNVGMTLVNYDIVRRSSNTASGNDHLLEGTDRRYFEQVKALSLLQCTFSTDFLLLYVAFGATATAGLITIELRVPGDEVGNLKSWYPALSDHEAKAFLVTGVLINWVGRLLYPMVSDVLIRVLYANPRRRAQGVSLASRARASDRARRRLEQSAVGVGLLRVLAHQLCAAVCDGRRRVDNHLPPHRHVRCLQRWHDVRLDHYELVHRHGHRRRVVRGRKTRLLAPARRALGLGDCWQRLYALCAHQLERSVLPRVPAHDLEQSMGPVADAIDIQPHTTARRRRRRLPRHGLAVARHGVVLHVELGI